MHTMMPMCIEKVVRTVIDLIDTYETLQKEMNDNQYCA